eukprot:scaffold18.g1913.t1
MGDYYGRGGGGGGGYQQRGGGGWNKRRREEEAPLSSGKMLLSSLIYLGDDALHQASMPAPGKEQESAPDWDAADTRTRLGLTCDGDSAHPSHTLYALAPSQTGTLHAEEELSGMVKQIKREARIDPEGVQAMLLDCAVQLSTKAPLYALLVGLLNLDEPALVAALVTRAGTEAAEGLAPCGDIRRARLLLRFLALLVAVNVTHASGVVAALRSLVDAAAALAAACGSDGRGWQPYADALVQAALVALPFGGAELAHAVPAAVQELLAAAEAYVAQRPAQTTPSLRPFSEPINEGDRLAESDSGAASFLGEVLTAVKQMKELEHWQLVTVPRVHLPYEAALAAGATHALPALAPAPPPAGAPLVPAPEGAGPALVGALVLSAYPPRGVVRLLEARHTAGDRPLVERLVAEEYILDMVAYFEADRVECAKRLANNLPLPFAHEPLLCEVLFSQMLRLPRPAFKPIMYATLMVDLCKLKPVFPRAMSTCVRECFARMRVLDPGLRARLAEWLAYHLSNFEYMWPWDKWAGVLAAPPYDPQRRFCVAVINRLVRLSYWERVQSDAVLPAAFRVLLPAKPEVAGLPPAAGAGDGEGADAEGVWAARIVERVRAKATPSELEEWMASNALEEVLGGKVGVLRALGRALLVAGAKSYTHMVIALERYYGPLSNMVAALGLEGETALVDVACAIWRASPQRASMAVDRLMTLRLAGAEAIVGWVFGSEGVTSSRDESLSATAWEILYNAVNKAIARVQDAQEDVIAGRALVHQAQAAVDALMAAGELAAGAGEQLEGALQAQVEKEGYLAETAAQQQATVVQVVARFVAALANAGGGGEGGGEGGEVAADMETDGGGTSGAEERAALRAYTLACLRSFCRQYHVQVAEVADRLRAEAPGLPNDVLLC